MLLLFCPVAQNASVLAIRNDCVLALSSFNKSSCFSEFSRLSGIIPDCRLSSQSLCQSPEINHFSKASHFLFLRQPIYEAGVSTTTERSWEILGFGKCARRHTSQLLEMFPAWALRSEPVSSDSGTANVPSERMSVSSPASMWDSSLSPTGSNSYHGFKSLLIVAKKQNLRIIYIVIF